MPGRNEPSAPAGPGSVAFVRLEDGPGEVTAFTCPLCGSRFTHGTLVCASCPMNAGCDIVKCPDCGYQFPRSSRVIEWARRWARRMRRGATRSR